MKPESKEPIIHPDFSRLTSLTILKVFDYLSMPDKISLLRTKKFVTATLQHTPSYLTYIHATNDFKKNVCLPYQNQLNEIYQKAENIRTILYAQINDLPPFIETQITDRSNLDAIAKKAADIRQSFRLKVRSTSYNCDGVCGPPGEGFMMNLVGFLGLTGGGAAVGGCTVCCGCISETTCASACNAGATAGCCSACGFGAIGGFGLPALFFLCLPLCAGTQTTLDEHREKLNGIIQLCQDHKNTLDSRQIVTEQFHKYRSLFFSTKHEEKPMIKSPSKKDADEENLSLTN